MSSLKDYLERVGGKDILIFDDAEKANAAAHKLRENCADPCVGISASYEKVFLCLRSSGS